jgi:polysaccharide export outer membrane protein
MKRVFLYLIVAFTIVGCTTKGDYVLFNETNVSSPYANKSVTNLNNVKYEYRIQPHDRISITMYNHPELGTTSVQSQKQDIRGVIVNSEGNVRLPLIKSIHVAGLTQTQAQKKIEKAYGSYLEDAEVYLEVLNKRAYIIGEVKNPGEVRLFNEKATLLQMLAKAGDFTDYANRHAVVIMRNRNNKILTQTVDLTGANAIKMANLMIYPNDIIYATPNNMKAFNVGVSEVSPIFGLVGDITQPIVNVKYLTDD